MTIDDDKSVYVGGLPYDVSEDSLRKAFTFYGHVVAVKINNEGRAGKCYGFVTFTNPRSAVDAIKDMNGRTIGGRVVRVNDVKTQGGRANTNREAFRRNFGRSLSIRDRDRDREPAHYEDQHRARKRDRSRDNGRDRYRGIDRENNRDQERDHSEDRDRERSLARSMEEDNRKREQEWERDPDLDQNPDRDAETSHLKSGINDKDHELKKFNGSQLGDQRSKEHSSESRDNGYVVEEELKDANQQVEELHKQVSQMEELFDEKQHLVWELQAKSQKLKDALAAAKKISSHRQMQLVKLSRCYLHMKNYNEKLRSSEQELESLVSTTMVEVDDGDDLHFDDSPNM